MCVGGLIGAFLADMIAGTKNYRSKKLNILAYTYILLDQWEPILLILLIQKDGQVPCCRMEQHKSISMP